jgi:hypothetical protein
MWTAGDEPVVNAIRELRTGHWLASEGELVDGVLVMRPIRRRHRCCGEELYLITEVRHRTYRSFTWSLRRCRHCECSYSIGPRLPDVWVGALARVCIELYCNYTAAVRDTYGGRV